MVAEKTKAAGAEKVTKANKETVQKAMTAGHETVERAVKTSADAFA